MNDFPKFLLLDGRAKSEKDDDINKAAVLISADTEEEAIELGKTDYADTDAIWEEIEPDSDDEEAMVHKRLRWDLPPAGGKE